MAEAGRVSGEEIRGDGHESIPGDPEAFVTMVTSDDFVIGAETMLHSLREHQHKARRRASVVMVTPGVSGMKREALRAAADEVIEVGGVQEQYSSAHLPAGLSALCRRHRVFHSQQPFTTAVHSSPPPPKPSEQMEHLLL